MRDSMTVTQKSAYWVLPPPMKDVPYAPLRCINFIKHSSSMKALCSMTSPVPNTDTLFPSPLSMPSPSSSCSSIPTPSAEEVDQLFASLAACPTKPAILALVDKYSEQYIPNSLAADLPCCLADIFKSEHHNKPFDELLCMAAELEVVVSLNQAKAVEEQTRGQANSPLWDRMRTGRVTATKLKAVCSTDPAMPSISLIMSICYPELSKYATRWGCKHDREKCSREI